MAAGPSTRATVSDVVTHRLSNFMTTPAYPSGHIVVPRETREKRGALDGRCGGRTSDGRQAATVGSLRIAVRSPLVGPVFNACVEISKMERLGQIGSGFDLRGPRRSIVGRRHDDDRRVRLRQV